MKAVVIARKGGPEVMSLEERPAPAVPADGVRVAVKAAGVNFADLMMRMGMYPDAPKLPATPGYEVSGVVAEVGPAVLPGTLAKGDRVIAGTRFGGYATEVAVPAAVVRKIPDGLSFEEAAAIPVNWLTAWIALSEMGRVRRGDRVLVESAAGGVGTAAVQLATAAGAKVVGLTGSPAKASAIRGLGAVDVWTTDEWMGDAKGAEKFDLILDAAGGKALKRAFDGLAFGGRVVTFGMSSAVGGERRSIAKLAGTMLSQPIYTPFKLLNANKGVFGLNALRYMDHAQEILARGYDDILAGFAAKKFRAIVGKTFPLADAGKAHEHLQSRAAIGKVVLVT